MCSSLSFQRCLITRGVTVIALVQTFTNVADIEDHAFNRVGSAGAQGGLGVGCKHQREGACLRAS